MANRRTTAERVSVGLVAAVVLVFAWQAWGQRWTHDDGFITLRVVEQVFEGNGPVYNAGQRVEAFTSPVHLALLVVLRGVLGWAVDIAWLGALLTLGSATAGLVAAAAGAARLARTGGARGVLVPFGLLVPVVLPPMWEYATSGLETGIAIGWVGTSFWLLARLAARGRAMQVADRDPEPGPLPARSSRRLLAVAAFVGLGPLVRPELLIHSVGFVVVLAMCVAGRDVARWKVVAAAVALPVAYEVFRMGYFASLVPNTALAKEAGGSRWAQGWFYLWNTAGPYLLVVPVAAGVAWLAWGRTWSVRRTFGGDDGRRLAVAMVVCSLLYGLYVVRVGGDYMHGRMVLLPIFGLCCPVAVVAVPDRGRARAVVVVLAGGLAVWAAFVLVDRQQPPAAEGIGPRAVAHQRPFFVVLAEDDHPITLEDYQRSALWQAGADAARASAAADDVLITQIASPKVTLPTTTELPPGSGTWLFTDGIGVFGLAAGTDVRIIDQHGLAHPLAARMAPLRPRVLAGHEKELPQDWALAEAGGPGTDPGAPRALADAARRCGPAGRVLDAVDGALTPARFLGNLLRAPGLTFEDVPDDPTEALAACDPG